MRHSKSLGVIIGMVVLFSSMMVIENNTTVKADPSLSDISDQINQTLARINDLNMNLTILRTIVQDIAIGNSTGMRTILNNLSDIQNNMTVLNITTLVTRLNIIDDMVTDLNHRLGYNISDPDASVYKDLSLILDGLSYEKDGVRYWLLKNVSGVPHLQIIGENQQLLADYQMGMNSTLTTALTDAQTNINSHSDEKASDVQGGVSLLAEIIIILLIVMFAVVAWKFFIKERKDKEEGFRERMEMSKAKTGRPRCFGDANQFDPEGNPNCGQCNWIGKCQTAVIRNTKSSKEVERPGEGIEASYDDEGNITEIADEGEPIEMPECFGMEFNPRKNKDCRECAINQLCGEQTSKSQSGKIKIPAQPTKRQQTQQRRSPSGLTMGAQAAAGPEDILKDF